MAVERIRAFLATARTAGGALLVTGEPGVGKTELLDGASEAASAANTRTLRAADVEFEAETSFSALNQLLPHGALLRPDHPATPWRASHGPRKEGSA
jgi:MoxR-like ATPase